jgi:hypothetical protein
MESACMFAYMYHNLMVKHMISCVDVKRTNVKNAPAHNMTPTGKRLSLMSSSTVSFASSSSNFIAMSSSMCCARVVRTLSRQDGLVW